MLSVPLQELLAGTLRRKEQLFCSGAGWRPSFSAAPVARCCNVRIATFPSSITRIGSGSSVIAATTVRRRGGLPTCGGPLDYFGAGTQRVEGEVAGSSRRREFCAGIRMPSAAPAVRKIAASKRGETDVVVGTQMVSKGFDLPQ